PLVVLLSRGSMLSLEVILLEFLPGSQIRRRLSDLKYGDSVALMNRYAGTLVFCTLVVAINFVVLDLTFDFLFDSPLFFDRFEWMYFDEALISYFTTDPRCVSAVLALLWITYPLARLTLFFCYLDVRIRKECWDLELDFRVEARRLEGQP
ncbi:MAG: hypothetical protein O7J95_19055, partial [Planctomycetota bacterium]|nr:hypothetical protein [Planctomycetota bacterium]